MSRFATSQRPRLSIVVPTTGDTAALEETLVSVLENRPDDCEIVVALGCEYDDPWNIREEVRFVQAPIGAGLVACTNIGISASEGEVVHVLAAGWRATSGWADGPLERFADGETAAVVPLSVSAADHDRVVGAGIRYGRGGRRIAIAPRKAAASVAKVAAAGIAPDGPALEAGFWRSDVLRQAGPGFSTVCGDSCADVDMAQTVSRLGQAVVLEPSSRVIAGPVGRERKQAFMAGLHAERLFWRSMQGRAIVPSLLLHGAEIVRHAIARAPFGTLPMLAGRAAAMLQFGSYLSRYRQLRGLVQAAAERQDSAESRTIRIDAAHAAAGRPKSRRPEAVPLRRSA